MGSLYALYGVSFTLIYTPTGIFHIAHGAVFVVAAYTFYGLTAAQGFPWPVSLLVAMAVAAILGVLIEVLLYGALRRRNASNLIVFVASTGVLGLVQAVLSIIFGTGHVTMGSAVVQLSDSYSFTNAQLTMVVVTWGLIMPLALVLKRSVWGTTIRAVGISIEAAKRRGVNVTAVYIASFAVGSALIAPAAFLHTWSVGLTPTVGIDVALIATAVTLIGEGYGIIGTALVGIGLGLTEGIALLIFPSGWQEGVTFLILFIVVVASGMKQHQRLGFVR